MGRMFPFRAAGMLFSFCCAAACGAIAEAPPPPPSREEWGFLKDLAVREPCKSRWIRSAKEGELDLSRGINVVDRYGVKGYLSTATEDLSSFLSDTGLSGGAVPLTLARSDMGAKEAYRMEVSSGGVTLSAGDDDGMRRAIYFFEDSLLASEAPALAHGARTRKPWVRNRITRCFFGPIKRPPFNHDELLDDIDYYPEAYLNRLAHEGANGLWLTVEFLDLAETSFTRRHPDAMKKIAKLRRTVEKCRRYGIKTWLFAIEPKRLAPDGILIKIHPELAGARRFDATVMCTSTEAARKYLEESLECIFRETPGLGGLVNISHGERPTTCMSFLPPVNVGCGPYCGGKTGCARCDAIPPWKIHVNTISAMLKGMRRANPDAEIISWFYQPQAVPERAAWVYEAARHVPDGVTLLYNFESGALKEQCGRMRTGGDYWLSFTGPSTAFERVAEAATGAGASLGAKIQVGCSHEAATVPFVPVPGLLYRKYRAMKAAGVSTVMQCWYFGNYPGIMNKAAGELSFDGFDENEDEFLERLARSEWGADAPMVASLWKNLSEAYADYPLSNDMQYYGPFHAGVAWPLYPDVRLKPLGRTWKPLDAPSGDSIGEALENHTLEEAIALADRMVRKSRTATPDGTDACEALYGKYSADRPRRLDAGLMRALSLHFESGCDILRFYRERSEAIWRSRVLGDQAGARKCLGRMKRIAEREREIAAEMFRLSSDDSRLGFHSEAECHQYHPAKFKWREAELESTMAAIDKIDAALARGDTYPESEFERTAPSCRAGGEWTQGNGFRFRVADEEDGDMRIEIATAADSVTFHTLDAAGVLWQRGVVVNADGEAISPIAWNAVTPGHEVRAQVAKKDGERIYTVFLSAFGWNRDSRLRPAWIYFTIGGRNWPDGPRADHRLNLGTIQGDRFGRILR